MWEKNFKKQRPLNIAWAKTIVTISLLLAVPFWDKTRNKKYNRLSKVCVLWKEASTLSTILKFYKQRDVILFFIDLESIKVLHGWQVRVSLFFSPLSHPLFAVLFLFAAVVLFLPPTSRFPFRRIFPFFPLCLSRQFFMASISFELFFAQLVTTLIDARRRSILSNFLHAILA